MLVEHTAKPLPTYKQTLGDSLNCVILILLYTYKGFFGYAEFECSAYFYNYAIACVFSVFAYLCLICDHIRTYTCTHICTIRMPIHDHLYLHTCIVCVHTYVCMYVQE